MGYETPLAHEEDYKGHRIEIHYDENYETPRNWDNVGTMVCWHSRYNLGDVDGRKEYVDPASFIGSLFDASIDDLPKRSHNNEIQYKYRGRWRTKAQLDAMQQEYIDNNYVMLPLYLYEHGGITISTRPFSCPWDSGQVGWIYVSKERCVSEWGTKDWATKGKSYLEGEVKTYDDFLVGNVFGFVIHTLDEDGESNGDHIDSCWGFYPENPDTFLTGPDDYDYCLKKARSIVDYKVKQSLKEHFDQLKEWIRNHVPLTARQPLVT